MTFKDHAHRLWKTLKETVRLLPEAAKRFIDGNTFQQGAALAYYAVFALPALIILITRLSGAIYGQDAIRGAVYQQIRGVVGEQGALDVQEMVTKASTDSGITLAAAIGLITLFIAATGLFVSMQESLNQIWGVRSRADRAWLKIIFDRLRSFGLILAVAFLLLISLTVQAALEKLSSFLELHLTVPTVFGIHIVNTLLSLLVNTGLFASLYRFLPDVEIRWRDVMVGAVLTSILFDIGRALIGLYLGASDLGSIYGAAGTVIVYSGVGLLRLAGALLRGRLYPRLRRALRRRPRPYRVRRAGGAEGSRKRRPQPDRGGKEAELEM